MYNTYLTYLTYRTYLTYLTYRTYRTYRQLSWMLTNPTEQPLAVQVWCSIT
jgi:hypothetical protein